MTSFGIEEKTNILFSGVAKNDQAVVNMMNNFSENDVVNDSKIEAMVEFSEKDKIAFSNQKLVPILEHEKGFVNDSWEIIKWLDENYPENKLFINETSKNFSYFLYLWTSRQLLPVLFKIIAHEIPNVLECEDINYYFETREDRINGPITKFKPKISQFIKEFNKLINPIRKIIDGRNKEFTTARFSDALL